MSDVLEKPKDTTALRDLAGIDQLRAVFAGKTAWKGIGATLDFKAVQIEEGFVVFEGQPTEAVYNPIGTVHGGYAATLLDSAVGCAVHSMLKPGQGYTTMELKVAYHRAMTTESGPVRAEGRVTSLGRRAAFAEGKLFDAKGRLCASATSTLLVFSAEKAAA
ncbi:MAG TPA: PaaI family thioesterase [Rhizomicrobium sp.]|jgi:uncharacterized protein (TIGR00369 family)|nr:PaaI family thioesterase [Rhizomicrobium sp.]